jgi:hypothetical protein
MVNTPRASKYHNVVTKVPEATEEPEHLVSHHGEPELSEPPWVGVLVPCSCLQFLTGGCYSLLTD